MMMLMNEHDDAYVGAMLMVNMQANTRSVTRTVVMRMKSQMRVQRNSMNC